MSQQGTNQRAAGCSSLLAVSGTQQPKSKKCELEPAQGRRVRAWPSEGATAGIEVSWKLLEEITYKAGAPLIPRSLLDEEHLHPTGQGGIII